MLNKNKEQNKQLILTAALCLALLPVNVYAQGFGELLAASQTKTIFQFIFGGAAVIAFILMFKDFIDGKYGEMIPKGLGVAIGVAMAAKYDDIISLISF